MMAVRAIVTSTNIADCPCAGAPIKGFTAKHLMAFVGNEMPGAQAYRGNAALLTYDFVIILLCMAYFMMPGTKAC